MSNDKNIQENELSFKKIGDMCELEFSCYVLKNIADERQPIEHRLECAIKVLPYVDIKKKQEEDKIRYHIDKMDLGDLALFILHNIGNMDVPIEERLKNSEEFVAYVYDLKKREKSNENNKRSV